MGKIHSFRELRVYQAGMKRAMEVFALTKHFPVEEKYSMTDQIRRSTRSVCTIIAEAWRKRRYPAHFVSKLTDAQSEGDETRVWLEFAFRCEYINKNRFAELDEAYDHILAQLATMADKPRDWVLSSRPH